MFFDKYRINCDIEIFIIFASYINRLIEMRVLFNLCVNKKQDNYA